MRVYPAAPASTRSTRSAIANPGPCARPLPATTAASRRGLLALDVCRHDAVLVAVAEVNQEADGHPDDQPVPVFRWQREHQEQARQDAEDWRNRIEGHAEGTLRIRIRLAHDQHRG